MKYSLKPLANISDKGLSIKDVGSKGEGRLSIADILRTKEMRGFRSGISETFCCKNLRIF